MAAARPAAAAVTPPELASETAAEVGVAELEVVLGAEPELEVDELEELADEAALPAPEAACGATKWPLGESSLIGGVGMPWTSVWPTYLRIGGGLGDFRG